MSAGCCGCDAGPPKRLPPVFAFAVLPPKSDAYFCRGGVVDVFWFPKRPAEPPDPAVYPATTPVSAADGPKVLFFRSKNPLCCTPVVWLRAPRREPLLLSVGVGAPKSDFFGSPPGPTYGTSAY